MQITPLVTPHIYTIVSGIQLLKSNPEKWIMMYRKHKSWIWLSGDGETACIDAGRETLRDTRALFVPGYLN